MRSCTRSCTRPSLLAQVLLLDEVAVTDVADALMLRKLFRRLFASGLVVVATSNRAPSELYLNGLQRASFLPFVDDIQARCHVHELLSTTDYRSLASAASGIARLNADGLGTYVELNSTTAANVEQLWASLIDGSPAPSPTSLPLLGRSLPVPLASAPRESVEVAFSRFDTDGSGSLDEEELRCALASLGLARTDVQEAMRSYDRDGNGQLELGEFRALVRGGVARFEFDALCGQPLGPEDYLKIAKEFSVVLVEGVPQLTLNQATELRRLITMVDAFYDQRVLLVLTAAAPLESLFLAKGADSHADKFGDVRARVYARVCMCACMHIHMTREPPGDRKHCAR